MSDTTLVTLNRVAYFLPDGRPLFTDLSVALPAETIGLIGRNGSGKTMLGRLIAGDLQPAFGHVQRHVRVKRVQQDAGQYGASSLADIAGVTPALAALRRLQAGEGSTEDLERIAERWDLEARWQELLLQAGLDETRDTPDTLSGGQRMLLALIGAFCSDARFLVLDEPSNYLDRRHRALLATLLARWREAGHGALVISHDRALLGQTDRTLELSAHGLRRYGGGWDLVQQQREAELAAIAARHEQARAARHRGRIRIQQEAERALRRNSRGERERSTGSQSKLLLNAMRDRAEGSSGRRTERHREQRETLDREVMDSWSKLEQAVERPAFPRTDAKVPAGRNSLVFDALVAPWSWRAPFSWAARGAVRVAIGGPNGCGKTTLLRIMAGQLAASSGSFQTPHRPMLVDQTLALIDPLRSLLEQVLAQARVSECEARHWLGLAGIGADGARRPAGTLSGGQQMRGALLCAALQVSGTGLLLLDEPTNHLDLTATEALEAMLDSWQGLLVVVSHDEAFLRRLRLTHRIERDGDGWRVQEV